MLVRFPAPKNIPAEVKRYGFVARPLLVDGSRRKALPVEIDSGPKIEPLDFGYVAGSAVHLTSGLEHCTLVALFDHHKKLGAAGHFNVRPENDGEACDSLNEFILNLKDMQNTLALMGATALQAFPVFGMTNRAIVAPVVDILQSLNLLGITVPGVSICQDGDNIYHSYLGKGVVNFHLDGTRKVTKLFEAKREPVDRAAPLLEKVEEALEYFEEICGDSGRAQFMNSALPYLAAWHFNDPATFLNKAIEAIDEGSELKPQEIGKFFKQLVRI